MALRSIVHAAVTLLATVPAPCCYRPAHVHAPILPSYSNLSQITIGDERINSIHGEHRRRPAPLERCGEIMDPSQMIICRQFNSRHMMGTGAL